MAEGKAIRLSKVAKELNLGIQTIAEFLKNKGIEIEATPNTKIDAHAYNTLLEEFQSDKTVKEESKKISLNKEYDQETVSIEDNKTTKKPVEKNAEPEKEVIIKNVHPVKESDENKDTGKTPKILGKIELTETKKQSKKTEKEEAQQKEKEEPTKQEKTDKKETAKEKRSEEELETKVEKLDGPKVLGKIDLPKEAPKKEKRNKPVASSSEDFESDGKKKRKRIKRKVDLSADKSAGKRHGRKGKQEKKPELTEEEIQNQIKETLARLQQGGGKSKAAKYRRQKEML